MPCGLSCSAPPCALSDLRINAAATRHAAPVFTTGCRRLSSRGRRPAGPGRASVSCLLYHHQCTVCTVQYDTVYTHDAPCLLGCQVPAGTVQYSLQAAQPRDLIRDSERRRASTPSPYHRPPRAAPVSSAAGEDPHMPTLLLLGEERSRRVLCGRGTQGRTRQRSHYIIGKWARQDGGTACPEIAHLKSSGGRGGERGSGDSVATQSSASNEMCGLAAVTGAAQPAKSLRRCPHRTTACTVAGAACYTSTEAAPCQSAATMAESKGAALPASGSMVGKDGSEPDARGAAATGHDGAEDEQPRQQQQQQASRASSFDIDGWPEGVERPRRFCGIKVLPASQWTVKHIFCLAY